jgi:hypothetical protein
MSLASLRECFSAPLEWIADKIKARPKAALMLWSCVFAARRVAVLTWRRVL